MDPTGGIDYSTKAIHWAVVDGTALLAYGDYSLGGDARNQIAVMIAAIKHLRDFEVEHIYLEAPWVRAGKGINTALAIHRVANIFEALAIERGQLVTNVQVAGWRRIVLGNGGMRTDQAKQAAKDYVGRVYGVHGVNDNTADAICIATYGTSIGRHILAEATRA